MNRKEEIILATLELASISGLGNVSLQMIADKVGIRKASLFNHFSSKDELIKEMYSYLRDKSKSNISSTDVDFTLPVEEILYNGYLNYLEMVKEPKLNMFYKLIYSERCFSIEASQIVILETRRMINYIKALFEELSKRNILYFNDILNEAISYAFTIHCFIDYYMDNINLGNDNDLNPKEYILSFVESHRRNTNEK